MFILAALLLSATSISCSPPVDPLLDMLDTQLSNVKIDSLTRTMNFVVSPERFQKAQFEEKLAAALNRWAESESELMDQEKWQVDPLAADILEQYKDLPTLQELDGLGFVNTDSYFLQQNFWARKLADRLIGYRDLSPFEVVRNASGVNVVEVEEDTDPLGVALQKIHDGLSLDDAEQLAIALKLFDWTVRNIYLLADDSIVAPDSNVDDFRLNESEDLAAAGVPGLGYTRFPVQTMLTSRGDYVDRAKLFMKLLDQSELDSVMLAVKTDKDSESRPWAVGVPVGGKLYLFDTKLGLPIPGKNAGQIATLSEAKSDPEILNSLDLSVKESLKDNTKYWVKSDQLNQITGLIYCSPESLTYRCWELENKLVGESRMKLYSEPSKVVANMPQVEGLEYEVWDTDFKTHQLRRALRDASAEASFKDDTRDKLGWYYSDELYINDFVRYRTARSKYFNGLFETIRNDGNLNAVELFYSMIYKDTKIDSLATDPVFQRRLSISQGKMSSDEFKRMIEGVQGNMRLVRRDSGYFLSQCHFDFGNYSTATNWLTRLETIEDTVRWQQAINYLRARSLEAQRNYEAAIEIYEKQESEHFHGDMLRVRQLKKLVPVSAPADEDNGEAKSDDESPGAENTETSEPEDQESTAKGEPTEGPATNSEAADDANGGQEPDDADSEVEEGDDK